MLSRRMTVSAASTSPVNSSRRDRATRKAPIRLRTVRVRRCGPVFALGPCVWSALTPPCRVYQLVRQMTSTPPDAADASAGSSQPPPSGSTLRISTVRFSGFHESGPKTACSRKQRTGQSQRGLPVPAAVMPTCPRAGISAHFRSLSAKTVRSARSARRKSMIVSQTQV